MKQHKSKYLSHKNWHQPKKTKQNAAEELRSREVEKIEIKKLRELLSEKTGDVEK